MTAPYFFLNILKKKRHMNTKFVAASIDRGAPRVVQVREYDTLPLSESYIHSNFVLRLTIFSKDREYAHASEGLK